MLNKIRNNDKGFTLVELVVAMTITSVLSLVAFSGVSAILEGMKFASNGLSLMSDINLMSIQFEGDIKNMAIDNSSSQYDSDINSYSASSFSFNDKSGNTIIYTIAGNTILRNGLSFLNNEIDPAQTRFSFFGYNSGGVQIDAIAAGLPADEVRLVTLEYVLINSDQNYRIEQTFALNYR